MNNDKAKEFAYMILDIAEVGAGLGSPTETAFNACEEIWNWGRDIGNSDVVNAALRARARCLQSGYGRDYLEPKHIDFTYRVSVGIGGDNVLIIRTDDAEGVPNYTLIEKNLHGQMTVKIHQSSLNLFTVLSAANTLLEEEEKASGIEHGRFSI